jgi:hypothetical protein
MRWPSVPILVKSFMFVTREFVSWQNPFRRRA